MTIFINNTTNTADIKVLKRTVAKLNRALDTAEETIELLQQQRDSQIVEASAFANAARTLAKKQGMGEEFLRNLRLECQKICQEDCEKRGIHDFAAKPPKFALKLK